MPKLLSKALGRFGYQLREKRSSLENPSTPLSYPAEWLLDIFTGGRTDSGLRVSEMTALQVATVVQCVNIIGNGLAAYPFHVFKRIRQGDRAGKSIDESHDLYFLIHNEPNEEMTSFTMRKTIACHMVLWGNGYIEIQRNKKNKVIALWPRNPARTRPVRLTQGATIEGTFYRAGTLVYETYEDFGDSQVMPEQTTDTPLAPRRILLAEDMIHIPGLSLDGRIGQDVIQLGRQAIGLSLAMEKYGAKFFGNGAVPQGLLQLPADVTEVQFEVLRRSWAESHGGENVQKTGVLPPGVTYQKTGSNPNEGQFLESRQHQKAELASLFNIPAHMVGVQNGTGGSAKSTVEQNAIEFLLFCLRGYATSVEQEFERKLFRKDAGALGTHYAGFDFRMLMYPDAASRSTLYGSGKQWGYLNTNDIHDLEDMNPVDGPSGDTYWMPVNTQDADVAAQNALMELEKNKMQLDGMKSGEIPLPGAPLPDQNNAAQPPSSALKKKPGKGNKGGKRDEEFDSIQEAIEVENNEKRSYGRRALIHMMEDAVGRARFRKKATVEDFQRIFCPVIVSAYTLLHGDGDYMERAKDQATQFFGRAAGWTDDNKKTAGDELDAVLSNVIEYDPKLATLEADDSVDEGERGVRFRPDQARVHTGKFSTEHVAVTDHLDQTGWKQTAQAMSLDDQKPGWTAHEHPDKPFEMITVFDRKDGVDWHHKNTLHGAVLATGKTSGSLKAHLAEQ